MIILWDNKNHMSVWKSTGEHTKEDCLAELNSMNDHMEKCGVGRPYVKATNEKAEEFIP